jgi:hypothetical protein
MYHCYITSSEVTMSTNMHRLQISLPKDQYRYLRDRARRDGVSAAEVIRQLLEREQSAMTITQADIDSALSIVGIGRDDGPLIDGLPVSENVDLYLAEMSAPRAQGAGSRPRRAARPKRRR